MDNLSKTLGLAGPCKQSGKLTIASFVLFAICLFGRGAEAKYGGGSNTMASAETSTYVFVPDQSAVVQTGGIAGVHETYSIEGQFRLIIDFDTGMASFDLVDANLVDESPFLPTQSLGELFNMAALVGTVVDETTIEFEGKTADGTNTDILLRLTFRDDLVHLTGRTVPPPNSADFFIFELDAIASKKYGSGTGEANGPYLIYTAEQMNAIGSEPNDWDKHFKLMADIDLSGFSYDMALIAPDTNTVKSGFQGSPFTGVFDGNSHTISHLTIVDLTIVGGGYLGLFGRLNSGAVVKNLGVVDVNITGSTAKDYVGGLVGYNESGNVIRCYSTGAVYGDWYIGGLVGRNQSGSVLNCYSIGTVSGDHNVGGLVGSNGYNSAVTACYSTGTVSGDYNVGGLVGNNGGHVTGCYSTGAVSGNRRVGGLVGNNYDGTVTQCFWDIQTSGQVTSAGGTGLTTAEMQDIQTYLDAGWDLNDEMLNGTCDYWQISPGKYPLLRYPVMPEGLGTAQEPYLIRDAWELGTVWNKPLAHYRLETSIDLSGVTWSMAVIPWFEGTFDGNGYVISNLRIQGAGRLGLFGQLASGANVSNLGLEAVNVNGTGDYVGGLVGSNRGSIAASYSTGTVSGMDDYVGGLVGGNSDGGTITNCYATGSVSGKGRVGGLVGWNWGDVMHCYSTGAVSGDWTVGGLVGGGDHDRVKNSFWDIETSGLTVSAGGVGPTTAEIMDPEILGLNGFGGDPNWVLDNGRDYPRLVWEGTPGQMIPEPVIDWLDGSGTSEDPFQIENADQLFTLNEYSFLWDKHFVLNADIDLDPSLPGRRVFGRAVIPAFGGSFVGNGHVILNLQIEGGHNLGFFRKLTEGSVVRDLGLEKVSVHSTGSGVGGLAGSNKGNVLNCYSTGEVTGNRRIGGLVGNNSGDITSSYSTGAVCGGQYVGGLVGYNDGDVTNSYSTGAVCGGQYIGGLVGSNSGNVSNCYSTGGVCGSDRVGGLVSRGSATQCFWDTHTSGQARSAGGTGLTTAEMQLASTFLDAGWDFVGESANGTEDIWWILEGQDYPKLRELPEGLRLRPLRAFCPDPQDGAADVIQSPILYWGPANPTLQHDIYFGDDKEAVADATTLSSGIYRGRQLGGLTTYDPGTLEWGKTYYWRIDEYNTDGTIIKGNVWSFTVDNFFIVVDDFEDYNDYPPDEIFSTWICWDYLRAYAYCPHYLDPPFAETEIVHGGRQSMPVYYENNFKYSEVTKTLISVRNWTEEGVGVLSLWLYGHPYNAAEQMYVSLNGYASVYHDNPDAVLIEKWTEWTIDLQEFAAQGVNLANVNTISIGFGDKNNLQPGGSGKVLFDDIRLYRPRPLPAFSPDPQDGAADVIQSPILHWVPAEPTLQHDIYFGEGKELVANATTESPGIYRGRQVAEMTTYDPGPLEWGKTYYWRIDEYNTEGTISKGNVWSFTTADFILIDDFEDYNDYTPYEIFSTWIVPWDLPLRGAQVGHSDPPFAETGNVHGGSQSMPVYYDNSGPAYYSEIYTTLVSVRDWTEEGVGVLSLWFYGDASNAAERMYVALNGYKTYHDKPNAALIEEWTEWRIDLQEFAAQGVNLANVGSISIGFGDVYNLLAGGSGMVLFDDIRLYRPAPQESEPGTDDIWWILEGQDYPRLWWELDEEDYPVVATENRPGH